MNMCTGEIHVLGLWKEFIQWLVTVRLKWNLSNCCADVARITEPVLYLSVIL